MAEKTLINVDDLEVYSPAHAALLTELFREFGMLALRIDEFKAIIKVNKKVVRAMKHELVTNYPKELGKPPRLTIHEIGYNKFQVYADIRTCGFVATIADASLARGVLDQAQDDWEDLFQAAAGKTVTMTLWEPKWELDRVVGPESVKTGRSLPHSDAWNKAIAEAKRGLRLKTKSREGSEWVWRGNRKEWLDENFARVKRPI